MRVELNEQFDKYNELLTQSQRPQVEAIYTTENRQKEQSSAEGVKEAPNSQTSEVEGAARSIDKVSANRSNFTQDFQSEKDQAMNTLKEEGTLTLKQPQSDLPLTKQNLIFLQHENQALRERTKEVRLILNRKMDELQQVLKATKQSHEHDLAHLKAECKKDLYQLQQQELKTQEMLKQQIYRENQQENQQIKDDFAE